MVTDDERRQSEILSKLENVELEDLPGYRIRNILFNSIEPLFHCSRIQWIFRLVKRLLFDSANLVYVQKQSKLLLISYRYERADHESYWEIVKKLFEKESELTVTDNARKLISIWHWKVSIKKYFLFLKKLENAGVDNTRVVLAADLVRTFRLINKLDKLNISASASIMLFDGNCIENTIVQYLANRGIETVTMQHGQPVFHGFNTDFLNQTMILNMTADYVIVPGEFSKKQFIAGGISEKRIKVLGTLKKMNSYVEIKNNEFTVFLNCPTLRFAKKANFDLIRTAERIAERKKYLYIIKLHPLDNIDNYKEIAITYGRLEAGRSLIQDVIRNSSFSLLNFSGVYIDIIANGHKAFVLNKYIDYCVADSDMDCFTDSDDLERKINKWEKMNIDDKKHYIKEIQGYYLESQNSIEKHKKFISGLIESF